MNVRKNWVVKDKSVLTARTEFFPVGRKFVNSQVAKTGKMEIEKEKKSL